MGLSLDSFLLTTMLGTFPLAFYQAATSQGYFPNGNFQNLPLHKNQLPKSILIAVPVLAAELSPQVHLSSSVCPYCSLGRLERPNLTFGKVPLGNLHIWEVATWNIVTWEVVLGSHSENTLHLNDKGF